MQFHFLAGRRTGVVIIRRWDQILATDGAVSVLRRQLHARVPIQAQQIQLAVVLARQSEVLADGSRALGVQRVAHGAREKGSDQRHAPMVGDGAQDLKRRMRGGEQVFVLVE